MVNPHSEGQPVPQDEPVAGIENSQELEINSETEVYCLRYRERLNPDIVRGTYGVLVVSRVTDQSSEYKTLVFVAPSVDFETVIALISDNYLSLNRPEVSVSSRESMRELDPRALTDSETEVWAIAYMNSCDFNRLKGLPGFLYAHSGSPMTLTSSHLFFDPKLVDLDRLINQLEMEFGLGKPADIERFERAQVEKWLEEDQGN